MKKRWLIWLAVVAGSVMAVVLVFASAGNRKDSIDAEGIGCRAVKLLYHFNSIQELDANVNELGKFCTPEVFMDLTIDNEERLLSTYLRFLNQPTDVIIEQSTQDYVIYRLVNDYVDGEERYVFFFHVNEYGVIDCVREAGLNDFIPSGQ